MSYTPRQPESALGLSVEGRGVGVKLDSTDPSLPQLQTTLPMWPACGSEPSARN